MPLQPTKKPKISSTGLVLHHRPNLKLPVRTAHVRDVRLSSRGHLLEHIKHPMGSRWLNWKVEDNEELGLDGHDENWELEAPDVAPASEPDATLGEKGKRKRSQTAVRYLYTHPYHEFTMSLGSTEHRLEGKLSLTLSG